MFLNVCLENFLSPKVDQARYTISRIQRFFFFKFRSVQRDIDRFVKNGKMAAARLGDRMPRNLVNWRLQGVTHIAEGVEVTRPRGRKADGLDRYIRLLGCLYA